MLDFLSTSIVRRLNAILLTLIAIGLSVLAYLIWDRSRSQIIQDISDKAKGTLKLASIAVSDPIWNVDEEGLENVAQAILIDKDVAMLYIKAEDEAPLVFKQEETAEEQLSDFRNSDGSGRAGFIITEPSNVEKEGQVIATIQSVISTANAEELILNTTIMIAAFSLLLLFVMAGAVALTANRIIKVPINDLKGSAVELAKGNLAKEIDTSRQDELGSLAQSFAEMRDSIRKKIQDLHVLNSTGEELAGMHDQILALQTALRVMEDQTHVTAGSVYLYNKETQRLEIKAFYPEREDSKNAIRQFKMGEGVAGTAAFHKEVIFIPDTSKDSKFVGSGESRPARSLLCIPMMDDQDVFGVMNFSGEVGQVKFDKSDAEFAETIARMTVVTTKNIQMLNVIEEQNRTLEIKVQERTAELRQKTNDINNMLQNMHQGIFTIVPGNKVHHEYSAYLEAILETSHVANEDVMKLLFSHSDLGSNILDQITTALGALIGEDAMMFDFNKHLLVTEFKKSMDDGRTKILELDWDPITSEMDEIEKIMVTVRDVTELRGLQEEAEKQKRELEIIGQILSVSQNKFREFTRTAHKFIEENEKLIAQTENKDVEVLATLFRNMHTIKGNARTYGFKYLTDAVHEAEHTYDDLRKDKEHRWNKDRLLNELHEAEHYIEEYEEIFRSKLGGENVDEGVFLDSDLLGKAQRALTNADLHNAESLRVTLDKVSNLLKAIGTEKLSDTLEGIVKAMPTLAEELGKAAPNIVLKDNDIRMNTDITPVLKDVFTHIFRNSMDHGIEAPEERKAAGKPENGTIMLETSYLEDKVVFHFRDDGRGLALGQIREKAIESGFLKADQNASDEEIAEFIFHSGLSTAEAVSEISGRGVGMDAVKRFLQKQGGDIEIHFLGKPAKGADFRPFESRITLPGDLAVHVA